MEQNKSAKVPILTAQDKTPYIVVADLPEDQREEFSTWLLGISTPVIAEEEIMRGITLCAYSWDYEIWYDYWIKGEVAPKD